MKPRSLLEWLLVVLIVTFGVAIAVSLVWETFVRTNLLAQQSFVAAFTGALFAFLFVRLGESLTKLYEKKTTNRAAILAIQHMLNRNLSVVSDDASICNAFIKNCETMKSRGTISLFVNDFEPIETRHELMLSLVNLDLINACHAYFVEARKLNHSMNTVSAMIRLAQEARLAGSISDTNFRDAYTRNEKRVHEILPFLYELKRKTINLLAATEVLVHDETTLTKISKLFSNSQYTAKQRKEIEKIQRRFWYEIEESRLKSQKEKDWILSGQE